MHTDKQEFKLIGPKIIVARTLCNFTLLPVLFSFKVFCLSCPSWRANIHICLCGRSTECCRVWCTLGKSYSVALASFTGKGIYSIRYKSSVITLQVTNIKKAIATIAEAVIFLVYMYRLKLFAFKMKFRIEQIRKFFDCISMYIYFYFGRIFIGLIRCLMLNIKIPLQI